MNRPITLATVRGISVRITGGWCVLALTMTAVLALTLFQPAFPRHERWALWTVAAFCAVLVQLGVLAGALARVALARRCGVSARDLVLHVLGGLTQLAGEPRRTRCRVLLHASGSLVEGALGGVLLAAWAASGRAETPLSAALLWSALVLEGLAAVGMLPVPPFEGAGLLHAVAMRLLGVGPTADRLVAATARMTSLALLAFSCSVIAYTLTRSPDLSFAAFIHPLAAPWLMLAGLHGARTAGRPASIEHAHRSRLAA